MKNSFQISAACLTFLAVTFLPMEAMGRPPLFTINPIDDQTAQANRRFQYQATFRVEDETCWMGRVSFNLTKAPPGMTITDSGKISWIPDADLICEPFQVVVHATAPTRPASPCGGSIGQDSESFTIDVAAPTSSTPVVGPYFHNILPQDFSSTDTGLKILVDVPPEPTISDVKEYVIYEIREIDGEKEKIREVATVPANRTGKLEFVAIDDHDGRDYGTSYTYALYARVVTFDSCIPVLQENLVQHLDDKGNYVTETRSARTRYADGIDAREAALRHRPLLVFDASEIYWPVNIEWMLDNADVNSFFWEDGPQLTRIHDHGTYTAKEVMAASHQELGVDYHTWGNFHRDALDNKGLLLDFIEYRHAISSHQLDSNDSDHNMGLSPATFSNRKGCKELYGNTEEWYYDCHVKPDDGRDIWEMGGELSGDYRAPNPGWKVYYAVYPFGDGEYEIVYQIWNAWDANWEDGDSTGVGATEFIKRHKGDQTTIRVITSNHGKGAHFVSGGMHGMSLFVRGLAGPIGQVELPWGAPLPVREREFKFYGQPADGNGNPLLYNIFLYQEGADPYLESAYQTPNSTFNKLVYWNFENGNPNATHPVMFVAGRSHGASPIPGVLFSTLPDIKDVFIFKGIDAFLRDSFTGTGLRWFPTADQMVPIGLDHPAFLHYIGWTGNWDRQERRGPDPGWIKDLTPPHSPYNIMRKKGFPGNISEPRLLDDRVIWWSDDIRYLGLADNLRSKYAWHGPRGPFAWNDFEIGCGRITSIELGEPFPNGAMEEFCTSVPFYLTYESPNSEPCRLVFAAWKEDCSKACGVWATTTYDPVAQNPEENGEQVPYVMGFVENPTVSSFWPEACYDENDPDHCSKAPGFDGSMINDVIEFSSGDMIIEAWTGKPDNKKTELFSWFDYKQNPFRQCYPPSVNVKELGNPGFENTLDSWKIYGDGILGSTAQEVESGSYSAYINRTVATGKYFGIFQEDIAIEPDTEYQLSLWVKTNASSGSVTAALGVWSSDPTRNHHTDFGNISGLTDWVHISATWTSRPDETKLQVVLFGRPDFAGEAYFDGLVLHRVTP